MLTYIGKRLATSVAVLFTIAVITFVLARVIPSDAAVVYAGPKAGPEALTRVRTELGLDRSLPVQFFDFLGRLVRGDLGTALTTKQPVLQDIGGRLPATLELIGAAMLLAAVLGVALGVIAARRRGGIVDGVIRILCIGGISVPVFWLGLLLQLLVVGRLGLLHATGEFSTALTYTHPIRPVTGFPLLDALLTGNGTALADGLAHLALPAVTLAAYPLGLIARMTRASMLEALDQDYTLTARAYGLAPRTVTWRFALKNSISPTLTVLGMSIAYALTGTFFVEVVFDWPGIGQYATAAMLAVDYPAIIAITLLGAAGYLVTNLVVDLLHGVIDPRTRS